jgi:hypothetical protein
VANLKEEDKRIVNSAILSLMKFFDIYDGRDITSSEKNVSTAFPVHIY